MDSLWRKAAEFLNNRRKDKRWRKIVTSLAAVVVFVTTYALILPAITMDDETAEQEPGIVLVQDEAAAESEVVEESDDPGEFENEDEEDAIVIDAGDGDHAAETDAEESEEADLQLIDISEDESTEPMSKIYQDDEIEITATYGAEAKIPADAEFRVTKLAVEETDAADEAVSEESEEIEAADTAEVTERYRYDIGFYVGEEEIEPEAVVSLSVRFLAGQFAEAEEITAVHYLDDNDPSNTETIRPEINEDPDGNVQAEFDMDSFSVVEFQGSNAVSADAQATTLEDSGNSTYAISGETTVEVGSTITLTESNANNYTTSWSSSNTSIATVDGSGKTCTVTGVSPGTVTITCSWFWGYETSQINVTVIEATGNRTVTFDANGGSGNAPAAQTAAAGDTISVPEPGNLTKNGYTFVGWSTISNYTDLGNISGTDSITGKKCNKRYQYSFYPVGAEFTMPDKNITLYAVWASTNVDVTFFIRLDGTIPNEPEGWDTKLYTSGITVQNCIKEAYFYTDSVNGVDSHLNSTPTAAQIATLVNKETITDESGKRIYLTAVDGKLYRVNELNGSVSYDEDGLITNTEYYVLWYVIKNEEAWHVDGVLLSKEKVNLVYRPNCPTSEFSNMPVGSQWEAGSTVTVGLNAGNGELRTPTRVGYNFVGWNTEADGSGTMYQPRDTFTITEDTVLYAIWSRGTNFLTVTKTDEENNVLAGAKFKLESKQDANSDWVAVGQEQTTNNNGVFTFSSLENFTIYKLTETYAPNGYETRNSFCFAVQVTADGSNILDLYICDENGNRLFGNEKPDWVDVEYNSSSATANLKITIRDEQIQRNVQFIKTDSAGNTLEGAEFTLTNSDGDSFSILKASDKNGVFSKNGATLPYGTYTLTETTAPNGYALLEPIMFTVNDYQSDENNGITVTSGSDAMDVSCKVSTGVVDGISTTTYSYTLTVKDTYAPKIKIQKVASGGGTDENPEYLSGAEFDLFASKQEETETVIDESRKLNEDAYVSADDGTFSLGNLHEGVYFLKETKAPDGYKLLTDPIRITVTNNKVTVNGTSGANPEDVQSNNGIYTITVSNSTGQELPHTGGSGTTLFTFGGLAILAGCLMAGYSMRRNRERRSD
ncbi:MAG: SpaA isopeptide-forming pilin-related protein [Butyricicoccus sp.]|jgi:uncharacterized repeat protein (TIGR02543 family)/LPXTG-motif cell wall-anchored protein